MASKKQSTKQGHGMKEKGNSPRSTGSIPQGRVKPDLAVFVWQFEGADPKAIAEHLSKDLEMYYQLELLQRSGFGQNH